MLTQGNVEAAPRPQPESEQASGTPDVASDLPPELQGDARTLSTIAHVRDVIQRLVDDGTLIDRVPDLSDSQLLLIGELAATSAADGKNDVTRALIDRGMIFKFVEEARQLNWNQA